MGRVRSRYYPGRDVIAIYSRKCKANATMQLRSDPDIPDWQLRPDMVWNLSSLISKC